MLKKRNRLISKDDFTAVFRKGRLVSGDTVVVKYLTSGKTSFRVGLSIGLAFSSLAVKRNRVKRQIRASVVHLAERIKTGYDIVIMIKKGKKGDFSGLEIEKDLERVFLSAKLLNA